MKRQIVKRPATTLLVGLLATGLLAGCGRQSRPVPPPGAVSYRPVTPQGDIKPSQTPSVGSAWTLPPPDQVIDPKKP